VIAVIVVIVIVIVIVVLVKVVMMMMMIVLVYVKRISQNFIAFVAVPGIKTSNIKDILL
jgi:hypothetical protein